MPIHVYEVLREHHGDRAYGRGEKRELDSTAAQHLVALKVLRKTNDKPTPPAADPVAAAESEAERLIAGFADRVKAAEAAAADQIGALDKRVDEARTEADKRLAALDDETEKAMQALRERRGALEDELQDLESKVAARKAEAKPENKAEGAAPANKAKA